MTDTYFKAVRPDGRDFNTGTIDYLAGDVIRHPKMPADTDPATQNVPTKPSIHFEDAFHYLSVSIAPTDCTGFHWPARLLEVEAVGPVWTPHASSLPNKRAVLALRVVGELDAALLFGHHGEQVQAIIERSKQIDFAEAQGLDAARAAAGDAAWAAAGDATWDATWDAARDAARAAARAAAWAAAWDAAGDAAWDATWDAAGAATWAAARAAAGVLTRDLIGTRSYTQEYYDLLTGPWRRVIGPIHPDDTDLRPTTTDDLEDHA